MPTITVTIEFEHGDGTILIERDDTYTRAHGVSPADTLQKIVACAEASALAAMKAHPQR